MIIARTPVALNQPRGEIKTSGKTDEAERERESLGKSKGRERTWRWRVGKVSATIYPSRVDDESYD